MKKFILFTTLILANQLYAVESYDCNFEGVNQTEIAIYPDQENSPTTKYRYQIVGKIDSEKPVVIYLPGGPGASSIDDFSNPIIRNASIRSGLPGSVPWIMIDPRTVGCNRGDEKVYPDDSLTSAYLAHDVLNVIEELKLQKYILYGLSYGSQSATYVAGLAATRGLPQPHAIFLAGVMGRGEPDGSFSIPNQKIIEWELLKTQLSDKARAKLSEEKPLGIEPARWDRLITKAVYEGYTLIDGKMRNYYLELLQTLDQDDPKAQDKLREALNPKPSNDPGTWDYSRRLFREVDCHEYSPDDGGTLFSKGNLYFNQNDNPCEDEDFDRMFDSAEFEIKSHIYYLSGTNDPAAPYIGARYHFENQHQSRRNFMSVKGAGHVGIRQILPDCKDKLWEAILNQNDLLNVLPHCQAEVSLEIL